MRDGHAFRDAGGRPLADVGVVKPGARPVPSVMLASLP